VHPLLQEEDRAACSGISLRDEHEARRVDQGRVLGAVDEARDVEVVPIRPARRLVGELRDRGQLRDRGARDVEITSYALPESQSTASCCVAGIVYPSTPTTSSLKPTSASGESAGTVSRQSSGLKRRRG
jgi:hypothetical protein